MQATGPGSVPAISTRRRKYAPACRARNQSSSPSAERIFPQSSWSPRPANDDWPRHCSRTARASLVASCPAPLHVLDFADGSTVDENGLAIFRGLRRGIRLGVRRKSALTNILAVFPHRFGNYFSDVGVPARKFRRLPKRQT